MSDNILEMRGITKEFPGVKALQNVNLQVERNGKVQTLTVTLGSNQ